MKYIHSNPYSFVVEEDEENEVNTYKFVAIQKQPYPCVQITIYENTYGNIDMLNYYANCSYSEKLLEKGSGTIHMLKVALLYVSVKHPMVKKYDIQDETYIDIPGKPFISARKLLLGEKGWYEEYLGAIPTEKTKVLIQYLRNPKNKDFFTTKIPKVEEIWWTPLHTMNVCYAIKCPSSVIGTTWYISKDVIDTYQHTVSYIVQDEIYGGKKYKFLRIFHQANKNKYRGFENILEAKYRNKII